MTRTSKRTLGRGLRRNLTSPGQSLVVPAAAQPNNDASVMMTDKAFVSALCHDSRCGSAMRARLSSVARSWTGTHVAMHMSIPASGNRRGALHSPARERTGARSASQPYGRRELIALEAQARAASLRNCDAPQCAQATTEYYRSQRESHRTRLYRRLGQTADS